MASELETNEGELVTSEGSNAVGRAASLQKDWGPSEGSNAVKRVPSAQKAWNSAALGSGRTIGISLKRAKSLMSEAAQQFSSEDPGDSFSDIDPGDGSDSPRVSIDASAIGSRGTGSVRLPAHAYVGLRGKLATIIMSPAFDLIMGLVIVVNIIVMVFETDQNAPCADSKDKSSCETTTMIMLNNVFLAAYTLEVCTRIFVLHCKIFMSLWNILDLFIVFSGFLDIALAAQETASMPGPSVSLLRIFRVFRLLRALRIFQKIPELHSMMRGFISAMQAMLWGFVMIIVLLLLFAVLCVEIIHPTLVAGDSWGQCTVPIIKEEFWTFPIFAAAVITVQLGFLNLVLAVIVERATRAKDEDENEARAEKIKTEQKATRRLGKVFETIDEDGSGSISLEELMQGFDSNEDMQIMFSKLDISRSDIGVIFELMDTENEGELSYEALIQNLRMSQLDDTRKSLAMLRLQSAEIARCCKKVHLSLQPPFPHEVALPVSPSAAKDQCAVEVASADAGTTANAFYVSESEQFAQASSPLYASEITPPNGSPKSAAARGKKRPSARGGAIYRGPGLDVAKISDVDAAMAALRASLDKDFAVIHDSIAKLLDSSYLKKQDDPSCQKQDLQATSDSQASWTVPRAGPQCSNDSSSDLRIVALLREETLQVDRGPRGGQTLQVDRTGEVSL